ncbi:MAG: tetratricopeptide repeat protein [Peptococcaceae bacterium]|jgi:tetratricopeptide (TPR) repeat protein|nr:tetratricopeptide repeat protein [Peptococcaceae bacterium]MDH7525838.1 tetratricopeptide repeat protein [Peptococcaceae bacterium]
MKDYYRTLDIAKNATAAEIKKAYFSLVRVFPPDRHPEEFMKIREAYEVLIDENTRRQYDMVDSMPDVVKLYFREGQKALAGGRAEEAIRLLERVVKVYRDFSVVNSLLGEAYLRNENSGKAIRIFEELTDKERNNAGFARQLAHAYAMRGWYKKAVEQYRRALTLDEDNLSLWLGLIDCYLATKDYDSAIEVVREGLEVSNRRGWDNLELYYHIIQIDIYSHDLTSMKKHLEEMKNKAIEKEEERANVAWFLATLAKTIHSKGLYEESAATIDAAFALLPGDEELNKIKKSIDAQYVISAEIKKLQDDPSIDDSLAEMLNFELHKCNNKYCLDCAITQFFYELEIVTDIEYYRKDVLRLKSSYPELYNMKKEFFDKVLNPRKQDYLFETYTKRYKKYQRLLPDRFESDNDEKGYEMFPQPYRRPEPKIGRNDPCPCGSGKKYKKCCGAKA